MQTSHAIIRSRRTPVTLALIALTTMTLTTGGHAQIAITGAPTKPTETAGAAAGRTDDRTSSPSPAGDADSRLADAAERMKSAVGVVVAARPGARPDGIGTAWAFDTNLFATNAHVIEGMEAITKDVPATTFYVAIAGRADKRLKVAAYRKHPQYNVRDTRFDGQVELHTNDFGVLRTTDAAPIVFKLASQPQYQALRAGTRVAFLGFPMESLANDNVDLQLPIATMQSGIVTAVSDFFLGDSGVEKNRLIRHNLPSAGGASGSPIFTPDGTVVAILWGGNATKALVASGDGKVGTVRQGSAALVNFAERIDGLAGVPRP